MYFILYTYEISHEKLCFSCVWVTQSLISLHIMCSVITPNILSLVTDNSPSLISVREENGLGNYFMINLHESMEPDRDQTLDSLTLPTALHGFCRADF